MNAVVKIGDAEFAPVRFTRDAIIQIADSAWFRQLGRVEIIDGVLIQMSPSWLPHSRAVYVVSHTLGNLTNDQFEISIDQLVLFGEDGMHAPDIAFFDEGFSKREPDSSDLRFVIEIAETTLDYDLGTKATRYGAFGIPELWVIDLEGRRLVMHRDPQESGYADVRALGWNEEASPLIAPDVSITLAKVLDR